MQFITWLAIFLNIALKRKTISASIQFPLCISTIFCSCKFTTNFRLSEHLLSFLVVENICGMSSKKWCNWSDGFQVLNQVYSLLLTRAVTKKASQNQWHFLRGWSSQGFLSDFLITHSSTAYYFYSCVANLWCLLVVFIDRLISVF
jgi:hypothetical protein